MTTAPVEAASPTAMALTAPRALLRSTSFRLLLAYLLGFLLLAGSAIAYVGWSARRAVEAQTLATLEADAQSLADTFAAGGLRRLAEAVEGRGRQPGAALVLLSNVAGETIAGNVVDLPPGTLAAPGTRETPYQVENDGGVVTGRALARVIVLPAGLRLLVGRDLAERDRLEAATWRATWGAVALVLAFGAVGAFLLTRRVLARVDAMSVTARRIMDGDLGERLRVDGGGDEFDRLALSLNAMLDRIVALLDGLREVSDNIAHDLRTPLTRLRSRAEEALRRGGASSGEEAAALADVIAEADELIRVFDALLLIARAEAGAGRDALVPLDLADVAREIGELYEPAAEEAGQCLIIDAQPAPLRGHRELLGRLLANLVENALKYGRPAQSSEGRVRLATRSTEDAVELIVEDRGPGVPAADRARVLNRFVRLEASRSAPGAGLGLALASAVVRLHGGRIALEDAAPGLRVRVTLPSPGAASMRPVRTEARP